MNRLGPWVLLAVASCGGRGAPSGGADHGRLVPTAQAGDEIVAEIDGVPIHASQIALQARAAGVDARAALATLIDAELLAGAALARGLADDRDVVDAVRSAEVRRLFTRDFERDTPADKIPDEDFQKAYDRNKLRFEHDEAREVWHLLAAPASKSAEDRARARAAIEAVLPRARAAASDEAFAALGAPPLKAEHLSFPRRGVVVEPFADAAFALRDPGATSGIVETDYGYHVVRLVQVVPPRHVSVADARLELLDGTWLAWRTRALPRWEREITERTHVEVHPELLAAAEAAAR